MKLSSFSEFIGNRHLLDQFLRCARANRLPQVLLFAGPDGVGKRGFAILAAKYLNCAQPSQNDSCGRCAACVKIEKGEYPELRILEPAGTQIKIDQIRELSSDIQYRPFEGRRKVYIIDPADKMNEEASNAFLKTLEECPDHALIVLVTSQSNSLLATIRSRCQVYRFSHVPAEEIEQLLNKTGVVPAQAAVLARLSGGSVGQALARQWEETEIVRNDALEVLEALCRPDNFHQVRSIWSRIKTDEMRQSLERLFEVMLIVLRDLLLVKEGFVSQAVNVDVIARIEKAAASFSFEQISGLETQIRSALHEMHRNVNPQILFEALYFES
ncbi:MAG TPA: DNA polymerase III subunit delta' [Acidobacteriota bacterium]|jgi:DNA polymerase-3 subunit delta'